MLGGSFVSPTANYRAYLLPWKATPSAPPAVSTSTRGAQTLVYASWNGATEVASWSVLAGDSPTALKPVASAGKGGFETEITVGKRRYLAVQAFDRTGHGLATSATVQAG